MIRHRPPQAVGTEPAMNPLKLAINMKRMTISQAPSPVWHQPGGVPGTASSSASMSSSYSMPSWPRRVPTLPVPINPSQQCLHGSSTLDARVQPESENASYVCEVCVRQSPAARAPCAACPAVSCWADTDSDCAACCCDCKSSCPAARSLVKACWVAHAQEGTYMVAVE